MKAGKRTRESMSGSSISWPQWSPAMKAGKRAPVGARKMVGELGARASGPLNLLDRIAVLGCQNAARARDSGGRALPRLSRVT